MKTQYQQFTCEKTSRNFVSSVITKTVNHGLIPSGSSVLDYGGGKYDKGTDFFKKNGITSFVYDPFNRTQEHNDKLGKFYDFAVCGNVLNVIAEKSVRENVITHIMNLTNTAFISVYCGNSSGKGQITRDGYQNNQKTDFYVKEIENLGYNVSVQYGLIVIKVDSKEVEIKRLFRNKYALMRDPKHHNF